MHSFIWLIVSLHEYFFMGIHFCSMYMYSYSCVRNNRNNVIRAVKRFLSMRLIMNSRRLWNLHQRYKPRHLGTFWNLKSCKCHFQGFSKGIFHHSAMLFCQNTCKTGDNATEMSQVFYDITRFERLTCLNMHSTSFTIGKWILYNYFIQWCLFFVSSYGRRRWK